ncbi:MAG: ribonuclease Z [Deltaproteobacteria bacterium]|nr:ribonuclease Z [Deltaproteobacteria bacterium]RLC10200.1 MAG: ribonuclease Z [Deltaproteobacteria bacterium]RLF30641.1 MAG: ribonuclease Z [Thermoplasmata archaeon]
MRPSFYPRLVNGPFDDPALFVPFFFEKRALLFDMGDLHSLAPKELLKITHCFVSHTHMDHFVGFDTLLRIFLGRNNTLHIFGPAGFLQNVEGKLAGYTWNLVENFDHNFVLKATEVHAQYTLTRVYRCSEAFAPNQPPERAPFDGTLLKEPFFSVETTLLDHNTPCLAFKLSERFHVNILKDRLKKLGIPVGPWLRRFKEALYQERDPEGDFEATWKEGGKERKTTFCLGDLARQIAHISPGQKMVYVVDAVFSPENARKIIDIARDADQLFIEAAFLHAQADVARRKYHLTARQAGMLARKAGVKSLTVFHFSPRYLNTPSLLEKEAREAFLTASTGSDGMQGG